MKKFLSYIFLIFGFLFTEDVMCKKLDIHTKSDDEKIIGGYEVDVKNVPYQAGLSILREDNRIAVCGGSIISKNYILTAAHCLKGAKKVNVRVGSNHVNRDGVEYTSTKFWQHPNYNNKTLEYDAGIISISKPIKFNSNTKAITLAKRGRNIPGGTEALASGWGVTSGNSSTISDGIMAAKLPIISNEDCRKLDSNIADNMICAYVPEGGRSVCFGDSGGPALSKYGQIGIASFVINGCATPGYPSVFARVSDPGIRDWIKRVTKV